MASTNVPAAEAAKLFRNVTVQTQTPVKVKDKDSGKVREVFETKVVPLGPEHVLSAKRDANGVVTIVTVNGRKLQATAGKSE